MTSTDAQASVEFVDEYSRSHYLCMVCEGVLHQPIQTQCGHRMCRSCLDKILQEQESAPCPAGESDCVIISRDKANIIPDVCTQKELDKLLVFCIYRYNGCTEQMAWSLLKEHVNGCKYALHLCPFHHHGCNQRGKEHVIIIHMELCHFYEENCKQCEENKTKYNNKGDDEQIAQHIGQSIDHHLNLVLKTTDKLDIEIGHLISTVQDSEKNAAHRKSVEQAAKESCDMVMKRTNQLFATMDSVQVMADTKSRKISEMERESETFETKDILSVHRNEVAILMLEHKELCSRLQVREEGCRMYGGSEDSPAGLVRLHDKQIAEASSALAGYDLRLQVQETMSHNGTFVWKIQEYSKHKADACSGKTTSLVSQPFYTSRHGYKLIAKVYPNGEGVGRGSHLSLYLMVMRGHYDALLPWPFRQRVSFVLLDQVSGQNHIWDMFRPDPTSSSFQKPMADMNTPCGSPMFVAQRALEGEGSPYIRNDTLFIKVAVDTNDPQVC